MASGDLAGIASIACGVGNNKQPLSRMRRSKGKSWEYDRPAGVTKSFQVINDLVESKGNVPFNIFCKYQIRSLALDDTSHVWPEVSLIFVSFLFTGY